MRKNCRTRTRAGVPRGLPSGWPINRRRGNNCERTRLFLIIGKRQIFPKRNKVYWLVVSSLDGNIRGNSSVVNKFRYCYFTYCQLISHTFQSGVLRSDNLLSRTNDDEFRRRQRSSVIASFVLVWSPKITGWVGNTMTLVGRLAWVCFTITVAERPRVLELRVIWSLTLPPYARVSPRSDPHVPSIFKKNR